MAIPFSILDLAPIVEGGTAASALQNTVDFARHAERYGYHRYWLAEHHNMPGGAGAATAILIANVAGGKRSIPRGFRRTHAAQPSAAPRGGAVWPHSIPLPAAHRH